METGEHTATTVVEHVTEPSTTTHNPTLSDNPQAVAVVAPIIEGLLAALCPANLPELDNPPAAAELAPALETTDPDRPVNRSKSSKGNSQRSRSRSRSPVDRSHNAPNERISPPGTDSPRLTDPILHSAPNQAIVPDNTVQVFQDSLPTSQTPLIELPFSFSDEDTGSVSDTSASVSLNGLEDIIDRYKDNVNTDTPLTQFAPNLPCLAQERITFDNGPENSQFSEESHIVSRFCGNVSSHEEDEND